jgi:hypothetical protein
MQAHPGKGYDQQQQLIQVSAAAAGWHNRNTYR